MTTWQRVRQMQEEDVTVMGKVASVNRGGLLVDLENLRGFVPTSHLSNVRSGGTPRHPQPLHFTSLHSTPADALPAPVRVQGVPAKSLVCGACS